MILHTFIEFTKIKKDDYSREDKECIFDFLHKCKEKEIEYFKLNNINSDFNQKEFYLEFKGKSEALDEVIDFLISELDQYDIIGKSDEQAFSIIEKYFESLVDLKKDPMTKRNITLSSFFYTVEARHSALARKVRQIFFKKMKEENK
jgi:hypothetical protein